MKVDKSKELTVTFAGQVSAGMPWTFEPVQDHVDLYPGTAYILFRADNSGEVVLAFFRATNYSDEPIIGVLSPFQLLMTKQVSQPTELRRRKPDFILRK